jgi:hypothetical protein
MCRPEKFPKASRIVLTALTSSSKGLMKMVASSAYMDVRHLAVDRGSGVRTPCYVANVVVDPLLG